MDRIELYVHINEKGISAVARNIEVEKNLIQESFYRLSVLTQKETRVKILRGFLSTKAYCQAIHNANLVVFTYGLTGYKDQPSGIMRDALFFGKPVVVQSGTEIAKQMRRYGNAGVEFTEHTPQSISNSIEQAVMNIATLSNRANVAALKCRKDYGRKNFVDSLLAMVHQ